MSRTRIRIKRKNHNSLDSSCGNSKVDLRNNQKVQQRSLSKKQLILVVFLLFAAALLGYFISLFKQDEFKKIVPENAVVFSLIDQNAFYGQISSFDSGGILSQLKDFLSGNNLDLKKDIQPLFKDEAAFILLPSNSETAFPFVVILKEKKPLAGINNILEIVRPSLGKNWNIFSQIYRQVEIKTLKPVIPFSDNRPRLYIFAQIEGYLVVGNSQEAAKTIIDSIMNN